MLDLSQNLEALATLFVGIVAGLIAYLQWRVQGNSNRLSVMPILQLVIDTDGSVKNLSKGEFIFTFGLKNIGKGPLYDLSLDGIDLGIDVLTPHISVGGTGRIRLKIDQLSGLTNGDASHIQFTFRDVNGCQYKTRVKLRYVQSKGFMLQYMRYHQQNQISWWEKYIRHARAVVKCIARTRQ